VKRILILGTSSVQKDAVDACHELGLEIHTCSNTGSGPAAQAADRTIRLDIADDRSILQYAEANQVDFIYSVGSDLALPTACRVSEALGLPAFVSSHTAETCHSKPRLRAALGPQFPGNLRYQVLSAAGDEVRLEYPLMLKPADSQGGRGVTRLDSGDMLPEAFQAALRFSLEKRIILEEFIPGPEVSVNLYLVDGQVVFQAISERHTWPQYTAGIVHSHHLPAGLPDAITPERILQLTGDACRQLQIFNGPVYFQLKVWQGQPYLVEAAPRLDGCHLWRLIELVSGVNLLQMTFRHLCGDAPGAGQFTPTRSGAGRLVFHCQPPGQAVIPTPPPSGACYHEDYYLPGEVVRPVNGLLEKVGYSLFAYPAP